MFHTEREERNQVTSQLSCNTFLTTAGFQSLIGGSIGVSIGSQLSTVRKTCFPLETLSLSQHFRLSPSYQILGTRWV